MAQLDEIVGKSNIDQFVDLDAKINKVTESYLQLFKIVKETKAEITSNADSWSKLKVVQEQTAEQTKKLGEAEKQAEKIAKDQAAAAEKVTAAINMEAQSIVGLRAKNRELTKERNALTTATKEGRKAIAELNKQIDANNETIKKNSDNLTKQKINVGNYISAWGPFQGIATMVTRGIGIMKIAFYSLSTAIAATGIGALVIALGALYTYFTRSGEGADKFAKFMAKIRAVMDVLLDRFAKFGEGLVDIFSGNFREGAEKISAAFKGIGAELKEEVKTAGEMADKLDEIDDKRRKYQEEIAKNQIRIAKLEEVARDKENYSIEQQKAAIDEVMNLKRSNYAMTKELNQAEIDAINTQGKMRELNDEEQQKLTDARIKLMNEEATAQEDINSSLKLRNKIYGEINEQQAIAEARAASERLTITETTALGTQQIELEIHAKTLEMREQMDIDFIAREDERLKAQKEERLKQAQEYVSAAQTIGQTLLDFNQFMIDTEVEKMEQAKAYELQLAGDNADKRAKIEAKYEKEATKLKQKQAKQDKAQALFSAIIKTAQAVLAGLAYGPPLGYVFAALNAVLGAVQIGVIASQPIPQFYKGTDSAPDGVISVAEKGQELIKTRSGKTLLARNRTLLSGMKGATIYSNQETEAILKAGRGGYDSKELRETLTENNRQLIKTIRDKREIHLTPPPGTRITSRQGGYFTNYWTRKLGQ